MKMKITSALMVAALAGAATPGIAASPEGGDQVAAAATTEPESAGMDIARAKDGMFYVDAEINGRRVHLLVDTGANVVVLTGADAARLGIQAEIDPFAPQMSTANGRAAMAWTRLDYVRLAGREVQDVRAAVVRTGLPVSLLGQNMLSKLASVTFEGNRLRLR